MWSKVVANIYFALTLAGLAGPAFSAEPPASRVLVVTHPSATQAFSPQPRVLQTMLREGILRFTGENNESAAWQSLVSSQDILGIKVHSAPGRMSGTRPALVSAIIDSLLNSGTKPEQIIIWDRRLVDLRLAGYDELADRYGIKLAGALDEGYDSKSFYPTPLLGKLVYGDLEFGKKGEGIGRNSYLTKVVTQRITKILNVTPLLNHNQAGVSGALYGLALGSVDNTLRFEDPDRLAVAVPEIFAMPELADRVVLNIVDALICQYRGEERGYLHYSTALNQLWFSKDPVAVDSLAIGVLDENRADTKSRRSTLQIYANAALMDLGTSDTNRIRIERLQLGETAHGDQN
jgi:hypothetical protein